MIYKSGIVSGERVYENPLRKLPPTATDLRFQISSYQVWRPGLYDSERAARYAFRFHDEDLSALQDAVNAAESDLERRVITYEMLCDLRARVGDSKPWEREKAGEG